ncbi:MAG: hypothetical protein ACJ786_10970 [Catenulispora sp.]
MEATEILKAASTLLGTELADPVDLGGSNRSTVLRARRPDGGTVILKVHAEWNGFAVESGGLKFAGLTFPGLGPRLLAADAGNRLIAMEDLGAVSSLADLLLGGDLEAARAGLVEWAATYGRLAARSAGRESELGVGAAPGVRETVDKLPGLLDSMEIAPPAGLAADLDAVAELDHDRFPIFSPGDICPDNNLLTADGLRPIDFEHSGFHSVFLDAAYARMPFSTCWCVFRLPKTFAQEAERAYRDEVVAAHPELADDQIWRPGVRLASVAHVLYMTPFLLPSVWDEDRPMHRLRSTATVRQILRYRWESSATALERAGELPAVAAVFRAQLAATAHWQAPDLPDYPAFRS